MANCEKEKPSSSSVLRLEENKSFNADFTVWDRSDIAAKDSSNNLLRWEGHGASNLLGSLNVKITLKYNLNTGVFSELNGTFTLVDGSEVYFKIFNGVISPNNGEDSDYYQSQINDIAYISGGTGRFTDVVGTFYPNVLIHNGNDEMHDRWFAKFSCEGRITNFFRFDEDDPRHERN